MRIDEFASAQEKLELWRLVSDSVWQAIAIQVKQEQQQKAKKARMAKAKRPVRAKIAAPNPFPAQPIQQPKQQALPIQKTQRYTTSTQPTNTSIGSVEAQTAGFNATAKNV